MARRIGEWIEDQRWRFGERWRSHYRSLNMEGIGLGVALLTLGAVLYSMAPLAAHPLLEGVRQLGAYVAGIFGAAVLVTKSWDATSAVDVERAWDELHNPMRDETHQFMEMMTNHYANFWLANRECRREWREYFPVLPLPLVRDEALHRWAPKLAQNTSVDARQFFSFCLQHAQDRDISDFRRHAMHAYDIYGRTLRDGKRGFPRWLERRGVREGGEDLLVILAYLEIARAAGVEQGRAGENAEGFWLLLREWFPKRSWVRLSDPQAHED